MDLHVYDVSAIVWHGSFAPIAKGAQPTYRYGYPIDGIKAIYEGLCLRYGRSTQDSVAFCFDSRTDKASLVPTYKSGRSHNPAIYSQIDSLYEELQNVGAACFKVDNYEADDLIHAVVMANYQRFDEVFIYGNDYDLCHSVRNNVTFHGIGNTIKTVNRINFSDAVQRGKEIQFNTISAYKTLCGCSSDKVPSICFDNGMSASYVYDCFASWVHNQKGIADFYVFSSDKNNFLSFIAGFDGITEDDFARVYNNACVVFPRELPDDFDLSVTPVASLNKDWLADYLSKYGLREYAGLPNVTIPPMPEAYKIELQNKAKALTNGVYVADKNLSASVKVDVITAKELDAFDDDIDFD